MRGRVPILVGRGCPYPRCTLCSPLADDGVGVHVNNTVGQHPLSIAARGPARSHDSVSRDLGARAKLEASHARESKHRASLTPADERSAKTTCRTLLVRAAGTISRWLCPRPAR